LPFLSISPRAQKGRQKCGALKIGFVFLWHVYRHGAKRTGSGGFQTLLRATQHIGNGFYGVDLKKFANARKKIYFVIWVSEVGALHNKLHTRPTSVTQRAFCAIWRAFLFAWLCLVAWFNSSLKHTIPERWGCPQDRGYLGPLATVRESALTSTIMAEFLRRMENRSKGL